MGVADNAEVVGGAEVENDINAVQEGGKRHRKGSKRRGTKKNKSKRHGTKKRKTKGSKGSKGPKGPKKSKRKLNPGLKAWIDHVKKFSRDNNINYRDSIQNPACKKSFKYNK